MQAGGRGVRRQERTETDFHRRGFVNAYSWTIGPELPEERRRPDRSRIRRHAGSDYRRVHRGDQRSGLERQQHVHVRRHQDFDDVELIGPAGERWRSGQRWHGLSLRLHRRSPISLPRLTMIARMKIFSQGHWTARWLFFCAMGSLIEVFLQRRDAHPAGVRRFTHRVTCVDQFRSLSHSLPHPCSRLVWPLSSCP